MPGFKPPRYERPGQPGVSTLTLPSVHSPASSPRTVRRIATARSDRSDATQYLPLLSSHDRAASPGPGPGPGGRGWGPGGDAEAEEMAEAGTGTGQGRPLLQPIEGAKQVRAAHLSTIEQIQRGSGCIYSKSRSSHLLLSSAGHGHGHGHMDGDSSRHRDRDRDRSKGSRPFKDEDMNDNYQPTDDDAVDLVLWR